MIVGDDGQIQLPRHLLDEWGIGPGDEVLFTRLGDGQIEIRPLKPRPFLAPIIIDARP